MNIIIFTNIEMEKKIITTAALLGMIAIILGAFGAHALKKVLSFEELTTFETAVKYQMYHALFLLFVSLSPIADKIKNRIFYLVLSGIIMFSGSIYLLATRNITNIDFGFIGIVTPIGGLLLILGWAVLLFYFLKNKSQKTN